MHTLRVLLPTLTLVLTILSFAFSIIAAKSAAWASLSQYTGNTLATRKLDGQSTRGPLAFCLLTPNTTNPITTTWYQNCSVPACSTAAPNYDEPSFCQQLGHVGNLLIAGSVLTGVAMFAAIFVLASSGVPLARHGEYMRRRFRSLELSTLAALLTLVAGSGCNLVASLWGTELLVNQQSPDGNFISRLPVPVTADHWILQSGVAYGALAWAPSIFAIVLLPLSFPSLELPRIREDEKFE